LPGFHQCQVVVFNKWDNAVMSLPHTVRQELSNGGRVALSAHFKSIGNHLMATIILFNKPFGVLSQFTDTEGRPTLADYLTAPGYRVAGRLDFDSEGLLLLTDNGQLQQHIANPKHKRWKTYRVQVEGEPGAEQISQLTKGVVLKDGATAPAKAKCIAEPVDLWPRNPPVRFRKTVADSWIELSIREGRNRQVRRMTAAVNCPTLRLIRYQIAQWELGDLQPGEHRKVLVDTASPVRKTRRVR
jgi:23S rRNA pseudouridine2457 synthase